MDQRMKSLLVMSLAATIVLFGCSQDHNIVSPVTTGDALTKAWTDSVYFNPWQPGNAAFECNQASGDCHVYSFKIDDWGSVDPNGDHLTDEGNVITIEAFGTAYFNWESQFPVCAVIVKGGPVANVYYYDGATSGGGLMAPINPNNGRNYDIGYVTVCFNPPDESFCEEEESAWAYGPRYSPQGNWATYVPYPGHEIEVDIFAGQHLLAGTCTISAPDGGEVTITIALAGFFFQDVEENLKIQDYANAPSGNPQPGQFAWKFTYDHGVAHASVVVPHNAFYGIHLDAAHFVPCPEVARKPLGNVVQIMD